MKPLPSSSPRALSAVAEAPSCDAADTERDVQTLVDECRAFSDYCDDATVLGQPASNDPLDPPDTERDPRFGFADDRPTLPSNIEEPPASGFVSKASPHPVAACVLCGWVNPIEAEECIACGRRAAAPPPPAPPASNLDEPELLGMRQGDAVRWVDPNCTPAKGDE